MILLLHVFNSSATWTSPEAIQTMTKGQPNYHDENEAGEKSPDRDTAPPHTWQPFYQTPS